MDPYTGQESSQQERLDTMGDRANKSADYQFMVEPTTSVTERVSQPATDGKPQQQGPEAPGRQSQPEDVLDPSEELCVKIERRSRQKPVVNYSNKGLSDREFEQLLAEEEQQAAKRRKLADEAEEETRRNPRQLHAYNDHLEQETAWAVGFNALAITEEEEELLPMGANETDYVKMRNYVLTKWRADVSRYLSEEAATAGVAWFLRPYAVAAWRFLDTVGYINFGVAPEILARKQPSGKPKRTVIIVGAGLAGLAAAQQLQKRGLQVVVVEGHGRPGGRVYTRRLEAAGLEAVADMGGSILTGIDGNPLAVLAKQLHIPMHDIETLQVPLYLADGTTPPKFLDEQVEADYNRMLDECSEFRDNLGEVADNIALGTAMEGFWAERQASHAAASSREPDPAEEQLKQRLFNWHTANLEFANAASIRELSVRSWDQDDPHELPGAHTFLPGGNIRLVAALAEGVPIIYNSVATKVAYCAQGVAVHTAKHIFKGDAVLVTVPLGVLKHGSIEFSPPLPQRKLEAIKRVGFGLLNKIVMLFPEAFWGSADMFGRLPELSEQRGEYYLFYSYARISGASVLAALVSGDAAKDFERLSCEEATQKVMAILQGIFEPKGVTVPAPLQVVCTRWGRDEMARGSYSSMAVGALGAEDYDILAESVEGRLFFAGEATTKKYPATMHGAFVSGQREAANIVATMDKAALEAEQAAAKAALAKDAPLPGPKLQNSLAVAQAELADFFALQLDKVFSDPDWPLEVEFGCFAAVGGPPKSAWAHQMLLRVDIGAARGRWSKNLQVYVAISDTDLYRLRDVSGGDEARFSFLAGLQGLKLVGRQGLSRAEVDLVQAILRQRNLSAEPLSARSQGAATENCLGPQPRPRALPNGSPANGRHRAQRWRPSKQPQPPASLKEY